MSDEEPTTLVELVEEVASPVTLLQVEVEAGGHRVAITAPDPLLDIAKVAVELWRATDSKAIVKGYGTSVVHTELCPEPVECDEGDSMGFRVT